MSNVLIDRQKIDILANAISDKSGVPVTMTLDEMVEAVDSIETGGGEPTLQAKTYTVNSAGTATVTADSGYDGLSEVEVSVPSGSASGPTSEYTTTSYTTNYVWPDNKLIIRGTNIPTTPITNAGYISGATASTRTVKINTSIPYNPTLTVSGDTVTIPSGYYSSQTTKSVSSGTAGTPTATKGTVSNHSVSVTPSVTNTTGYITGSTINGTAVTVTASELASGNKAITENGTGIDVVGYSTVSVNVPSGQPTLQSKTYNVSSAGTSTVTADSGYDGLSSVEVSVPSALQFPSINYRYATENSRRIWKVTPRTIVDPEEGCRAGWIDEGVYDGTDQVFYAVTQNTSVTPTESAQTIGGANYMMEGAVTVNAIPSTYVGSGITRRSSSDLTASGATVTVPAGYYSAAASKSVASMTLPTSAASSATSGYTSKATIGRSTAVQYINIPPGYNSAGAYYVISATPNGSVTAPTSISGTAASVSTGTNTLTLTKTVSVTPNVTTAGYISSGTAGNSSVSLTASVTTKAAATITPTTTNQTIAAGTYLTGTQTIAGDADLVASNIKKDVNIFGVTGTYDPTDFIINLTQDANNKWIPDCTFAEAEAALNSGKALKFVAEYPAGDTYFGGYNDLDRTIAYGVVENTSTLSGTVLVDKSFIYDVANTVTQDLTSTYYTTTHATAQASDVISTKTFFNGSGYQTGTLDLTDVYIRSAAPTSSVGSDGDIYIQE